MSTSRPVMGAASFVLPLALAAWPSAALAQPCAARASFRLENNMSGSQGTPEVFAGTGNTWVSTVPLIVNASNTNSNALGCFSSAWGYARATPGELIFAGGGSGHNAPGNGCFLWIDEWIGAAPKAEYYDRLTISSATLPVLTPGISEQPGPTTGDRIAYVCAA